MLLRLIQHLLSQMGLVAARLVRLLQRTVVVVPPRRFLLLLCRCPVPWPSQLMGHPPHLLVLVVLVLILVRPTVGRAMH